jgi:hypothetical protein
MWEPGLEVGLKAERPRANVPGTVFQHAVKIWATAETVTFIVSSRLTSVGHVGATLDLVERPGRSGPPSAGGPEARAIWPGVTIQIGGV